MAKPKPSNDGRTVTVRVPISIRERGGRKLVLAPNGEQLPAKSVTRHVDNAMVKAVARAYRWRDMLETGEYATIREIATAEKISETYVGRLLRLTLLAPHLIEEILRGKSAAMLQLDDLLEQFPLEWSKQRQRFSFAHT